ncbi:hypothetical protein ACIPWL_30040 [Streptomyces sp. NPDC090023]|uniref:hypothetical protein n=1 Tax=Streptomyces sp. NPDC090023 TaxID=3365921 RepID=UPI0037F1759D
MLKEYEEESRPSVKVVLEEVEARLKTKFKLVKVPVPPRTTAYRWMQELERHHPTFRLSTQRNRDIAGRPRGVYGKPRPGEYVLMDTTRLDVFALDPVTLRWMQAELTIAMDWYTRCIIGLRVTPVSTKAIDAAAVLYQAYRPQLVPESWPREAAWPEHGIPRGVLVETEVIHGPLSGVWGPGTSLVERRMALRLSREQVALDLPQQQADDVSSLPSVARVLSLPEQPVPPAIEAVQEPEAGDADADGLEELEEELDFYATALKDIDD